MSKSSSRKKSHPPVTGRSGLFAELLDLEFSESSLTNPPPCPGVYFLVDYRDRPLYIGHSQNIRTRIWQHKKQKKWFPDAGSLFTIEDISTESDRLTLETVQILRYLPRHNRAVYLAFTLQGGVVAARWGR